MEVCAGVRSNGDSQRPARMKDGPCFCVTFSNPPAKGLAFVGIGPSDSDSWYPTITDIVWGFLFQLTIP